MKKSLIGLLLSLSCCCALAAVGCKDKGNNTAQDGKLIVDFTQADGWDFVSDTKDGAHVDYGEKITFSVDVSVFYTGSPVVYVNTTPIVPNSDGMYTVEVKENVTIKVEGVRKDVSNMEGSGSHESPFAVSKPIDLIYIAEQVNAGNYAYVTGSYVLVNDIDCGGEELKIIGDYSTENSYFAGCFVCNSDSETGDYTPATISNFVINSNDTNNVGLFGSVMVMPTVSNSGLFYGINLDNFTINASITNPPDEANRSIFCGSLIGYGVGAKVYICNATNGTINLYADDSYFSFTGGMLGYQQGGYDATYGVSGLFPGEVVYAVSDVDVNVMQGVVLYAGGISGYLATNAPYASSYVQNSYATGNVTGAIRAGGIAGGLGQYTSVSNCYATGEIVAKATQTISELTKDALEYCYANAGGIAGHADNDTIVNNCFFTGKTYATAKEGKAYANANLIIGGGYETNHTTAISQKYVEWKNYPSNDVNVNNIEQITSELGWLPVNWIISNGSYPTINYAPTNDPVQSYINRHYLVKDANGEWQGIQVQKKTTTTEQFNDTSEDGYGAIVEAFLAEGGLPYYYQADDGVHLSYGYFLDEACTIKLPLSYVPMETFDLYIPFADPTEILGEYVLKAEGTARPLTLRLTKDGKAFYTDGVTEDECNFGYDGETLIIELSRLSRYYNGAIIVDATDSTADPNFDMARYSYSDIKGVFDGDTLKLYDGTYFTEEKPLLAQKNIFRGEYYTENNAQYKFYGTNGSVSGGDFGYAEFTYTYNTENNTLSLVYETGETATLRIADLSEYDAFKGSWTKSATVNKTFTFDGMGNWWYVYSGYTQKNYYQVEETVLERLGGTYTVSDNTLKLNNGYIVSFNSDGFLEIKGDGKTQIYGRAHSYLGEWTNKQLGLTLQLNGIGESGLGKATLRYDDGSVYEMDYEATETNGYVGLYQERIMQAYFYHDRMYNSIILSMYDDEESAYVSYNLYAVDNYDGEWISNVEAFENVTFNGEGLYSNINYVNMKGSIHINNEKVSVNYELLNSTLNGTFVYNGEVYTMVFDEDNNSVTLYGDSATIQLERKDEFAGETYIDKDGNEFEFDGKSKLIKGGSFKFGGNTYAYRANGENYDVADGNTTVGEIIKTETHYQLTLNGETHELYIKNKLTGKWAISGDFDIFEIGPTDLQGNIKANFKGFDVTLSYIDATTLTFKYTVPNYEYTYYVFLLNLEDEESFAISQKDSLYAGDYQICNRPDALFGTWTAGNNSSLTFDGVQSNYANGLVKTTNRLGSESDTYYYKVQEDGILMWMQDNSRYYKIEFIDIEDFDAKNSKHFKNGDKAIVRTEVDSLYLTKAKDANGVSYVFDGGNVNDGVGTVTADNGKTYIYKDVKFNTNNTANITLVDKETNEEFSILLDYKDRENITLTFVEEE